MRLDTYLVGSGGKGEEEQRGRERGCGEKERQKLPLREGDRKGAFDSYVLPIWLIGPQR